jgi:hypothetical protein
LSVTDLLAKIPESALPKEYRAEIEKKMKEAVQAQKAEVEKRNKAKKSVAAELVAELKKVETYKKMTKVERDKLFAKRDADLQKAEKLKVKAEEDTFAK